MGRLGLGNPKDRMRTCTAGMGGGLITKNVFHITLNSKIPKVTFEPLDPSGFLDALGSLSPGKKLQGNAGVIQPSLGLGYKHFLDWALLDIAEAGTASTPDSRQRFSVNAIMNARRALSCLVDQYWRRDGFAFCKDGSRDARKMADILVRRAVFDRLASGVLERAISRRNHVEHQYGGIELEDAQDMVQVVRATIESVVARSDPYCAPAMFGTILGGCSTSEGGVHGRFDGWSGNSVVFGATVSPAWIGIIVPKDECVAVVRKVETGKLTCEQLLSVLEICGAISGGGGGSCSENLWEARLRSAGLLN